jgi:molecular chaperone Hsp33
MVAVANNRPTIKAYVTEPHVDIPLNEFGKLDVGGAVGNIGFINVIKDIGLKDPYIGMSELVTGEIGDDFANYFAKSEQRNSAVAVGVLVDKNGVRASGGYIINAMPDATQEDISKIEKAIFEAGAISKMLDNNLTLEQIAQKVTGDVEVKTIEDNILPKYECDCSKENMEKALISIGKKELEKIIEEDENVEIVCHFCNKKYNFEKSELEGLLTNQ